MKRKKLIYFLAGIFALFIICFFYLNTNIFVKPKLKNQEKTTAPKDDLIGILSRDKSGLKIDSESMEHRFLMIRNGDSKEQIANQIKGISSEKRLLITVEVYGAGSAVSYPGVLEDVIKGDFDDEFNVLFSQVSSLAEHVFIRWNPDMEVPVKLFPWQYQSPVTYIEAFNRFAKICKQKNPAVSIVWGAAGYPGAEEYWPGPDWVDYTSVTINGKSESAATAFPIEKNMETVIRRKILRMRFTDKPILLLASGRSEEDLLSLKSRLTNAVSKINLEKDIVYPALHEVSVNSGANLQRKAGVITGVYDPKLLLTKSGRVNVEHIFIDLGNIQDSTFQRDFNAIMHRKHAAIVTVEPWRDKIVRKDTNVLLNTVNGVYDEEFEKLYEIISNSGQTVYLRFAHEMEIPIHRYEWQSQDPVLYIKAFRHFMSLDKHKAANIKKVWGPAGDRGSMEFWPGNDVVDYISIAIYGLPDKNITDENQQESFNNIYNRKSYRMRLLNKPMFITEFGAKGSEKYQQKWLSDATATINNHKEIHGVCYFNLADNPKVWGKIPPPDWSISKKSYELFVRAINTN